MIKPLLKLGIVFLASTTIVQAQKMFTEVSKQAGINHQFEVFEGFLGGGACVIDINNDGFDDIFIAGGKADDVLYLNNRNGTFTNIYTKSGLTKTRNYLTQGAVAADVNRDGWVDLYITTITSKGTKKIIPREINLLFLNNKNNTFRDATKEYGLGELYSFSTGANFGDVNADGYPDLYVGNYFTQYPGDLSTINASMIVGANQIGEGNLLINQQGKGFKDEYKNYGLSHKGFGFGGVFTDYDNDGDQDLIVNHDFGYKKTPNLLLDNQYPMSYFNDVAPKLGMDLKINSMGTAVGDYNNDGLMDYFFTNIRFNKLMINNGAGKPFSDKTAEAGLNTITISWGANFADFDHDGDLDLFVVNGDLNPNCVPMGDFYFENNNGKYTDLAGLKGINDYGIGRGSVMLDYDNDGDLDLLVVNQKPVLPNFPTESVTHLYRNDGAKGNWIKIALKGIQAETHGLGSKVEIVVGGKHYIREIDGGGSSHLSQNATFAHFGLGNATQVDEIIVHWTGGYKQALKNQKANQLVVITEEEHVDPLVWTKLIIGVVVVLVLLGGYFIWKNVRKKK
ncbi:CRTAC1 family protein [Emticicia sp. ODNR4P]|nr:CRTAC1 family protein [Emticicia sp. ODNR4P]